MNLLFRLKQGIYRPSLANIPTLHDFMKHKTPMKIASNRITYIIETYGCQMNENDSDIVRSLMNENYDEVDDEENASIVLINTCSIREKAEEKIIHRLKDLKKKRVVGILGCMAERKKKQLFEKGATVVCGPDKYRNLPNLIETALLTQQKTIDVKFDFEETYSGIQPTRKSNLTASLTIMRGCNNMCSFCVVPFVRGRERSRQLQSIFEQIDSLQQKGTKQITFLGQNVNSYHDTSDQDIERPHQNTTGFTQLYKLRSGPGFRFVDLLQQAAIRYPDIRFKFTSPHPKDFPEQLLRVIGKYPNIFKSIHLPVQSGSTEVLSKMRRNHSREAYVSLVKRIREQIPDVTLSTDVIVGFCGETEEQFEEVCKRYEKQTLSLMAEIKYDMAFLFAYSMREATHAYHSMEDDVPEVIKKRRLQTLVDLFVDVQAKLNANEIDKIHLILVSSVQKGSFRGLTQNNKKAFLLNEKAQILRDGVYGEERDVKIGDYVVIRVKEVGARFVKGEALAIVQRIEDYQREKRLLQAH